MYDSNLQVRKKTTFDFLSLQTCISISKLEFSDNYMIENKTLKR